MTMSQKEATILPPPKTALPPFLEKSKAFDALKKIQSPVPMLLI